MGNSRGFRRNLKVFEMSFEEYEDLQVKVRSVPIGQLLDVLKLADAVKGGDLQQEAVNELFGWFAARIVSWTYQDEEGEPLPPTQETLLADDFDFVMKLIMAWVSAVTSSLVPTTPGPGDTSSRDPVETSIPMTAARSGSAGT